MKDCIEGAKNLISKQINIGKISVSGIPFSKYQKIYFSTNENIKEYFNLVNFNNKKNALTVLASGDHSFNLINKGILNIDTFDTNTLTEYYVFGIKRAMVLKYNYKEYLKVLKLLADPCTFYEIINDIIYELLPYMDKKHRIFWNEILNYNNKEQHNKSNKLNLIRMLFINIDCDNGFNNYLNNEEEYNIFKHNINRSNINFKCTDAINLHKEFKNKYDFILLSNILDYFFKKFGYNWNINDLTTYISKLHCLTKEDSIIFVNYIYTYYSENFTREKSLIKGADINYNDLIDYNVIKLPCNKNSNNRISGDGIILTKKK